MNKADGIHRPTKDTGISILGLAELIANRIVSIKEIHAEKGESPAAEIGRQFALMCRRTILRSGPCSTADMALLASQLVPEALARIAA